MEVTFLGTGTSCGIPMIGCDCPVCQSSNPKNQRLRTSAWIKSGNTNIIIDTGPDFRAQMLRSKVNFIDAVLYTHDHADHTNGLDDIRSFTMRKKKPIELFGNEETIASIRNRFSYCFNPVQIGGGIPNISLNTIQPYRPFHVNHIQITPLPGMHGKVEVIGYLFPDFAYFTDLSFLPERTFEAIKDIPLLIINALRYRKHSTHFNLEEAIETAKRVNPKQAYFVHISHQIDHERVSSQLPPNIHLAYDMQKLSI